MPPTDPLPDASVPRRRKRRHKGRKKAGAVLRAHHLFDALSVSDTLPGAVRFPAVALLDAGAPWPRSGAGADLLLAADDEPAAGVMAAYLGADAAQGGAPVVSTVDSLVGLYIGGDFL
jgi:hypothetical protein